MCTDSNVDLLSLLRGAGSGGHHRGFVARGEAGRCVDRLASAQLLGGALLVPLRLVAPESRSVLYRSVGGGRAARSAARQPLHEKLLRI